MINAQVIKIGTCIRMDGKLYFCIDFLHVKPGKGNTFMRTKLKDVVNGYVLERRFNIGEKLEPIKGTPIDLLNMPAGCPFAPRCDAAMKICLRERAERMRINDDHLASCWMNVKLGVEDGSITEEGGVPCV